MTLRSHALAFSSGVHSRSPASWLATSNPGAYASYPRNMATAIAPRPATEVDSAQPQTAVDAHPDTVDIASSNASRLAVPFVGSGRTGTVRVRQRLLQDHLKVRGCEGCEMLIADDKLEEVGG